jgi:hypothetical protein
VENPVCRITETNYDVVLCVHGGLVQAMLHAHVLWMYKQVTKPATMTSMLPVVAMATDTRDTLRLLLEFRRAINLRLPTTSDISSHNSGSLKSKLPAFARYKIYAYTHFLQRQRGTTQS